MASSENGVGDHVVELIVREAASGVDSGDTSDEISPLLSIAERPKINIFTVSYPRRRSREQVIRSTEAEISPIMLFTTWVWGGSRYSGLLCMAVSSTMYFLMGIVSDVFSVQSIPLFETALSRCTVILICSYIWLRRTKQPLFGLVDVKYLLISRAFSGFLSLSSFVYCIQRLPSSQAVVMIFTTPIMASVMARIFLREKLKISDVGGLACSFLGVLFIFHQLLAIQDVGFVEGRHAHIYAVLVGLFSAITGGISFCLIRAGAKASDQPIMLHSSGRLIKFGSVFRATVCSFGLLSTPAAGICSFAFEEFVIPGQFTFMLMLVLGFLAFLAEVFLARALQLEKTSKVANVQFIVALLSQLWSVGWSSFVPSFGGIMGSLLIIISVSGTFYVGPDKESESN